MAALLVDDVLGRHAAIGAVVGRRAEGGGGGALEVGKSEAVDDVAVAEAARARGDTEVAALRHLVGPRVWVRVWVRVRVRVRVRVG